MGTAWFVDGGYAIKAWKSVASGARLDFKLLRSEIERDADEQVGDAYYFNCDDDPPTAGQDAFHRFLKLPPPKGPGLRVKLYWLQQKKLFWPQPMGGGPVVHPDTGEQFTTKTQKAVDVGLAFHLMRSHSKVRWDKLYLVAGDGDFAEVIHHLVENEGVHVTIIGTESSVSSELTSYVTIVDFDAIKDRVELKLDGPAQTSSQLTQTASTGEATQNA